MLANSCFARFVCCHFYALPSFLLISLYSAFSQPTQLPIRIKNFNSIHFSFRFISLLCCCGCKIPFRKRNPNKSTQSKLQKSSSSRKKIQNEKTTKERAEKTWQLNKNKLLCFVAVADAALDTHEKQTTASVGVSSSSVSVSSPACACCLHSVSFFMFTYLSVCVCE